MAAVGFIDFKQIRLRGAADLRNQRHVVAAEMFL
jgi:hypothetical protein